MKTIDAQFFNRQKRQKTKEIQNIISVEQATITSEEYIQKEKELSDNLERLKARAIDECRMIQNVPSPCKNLLFKKAISLALKVAKYFEFDIQIRANDSIGIILMQSDQILSDEIWHDGRNRRQLLMLIRLADSVWIDPIKQDGDPLIQIGLSYKLTNTIRKRP